MVKILKFFKVKGFYQLIIVFTVFAITGSLSIIAANFLVDYFPYQGSTSILLYWALRIIIIFPIYQLLLIIVGTIFGQFKYFWNFEKKMLKKLRMIK